MIELNQVTKSFFGNTVLQPTSLFIQEGEMFGIIGQSGAGKSTLLRLINLLERPDRGNVIVDGRSLCHLNPRELRAVRHNIGMIFQHFNLLEQKTVFENIALPLRLQKATETETQARVSELLALVELTGKAHYYPNQLSGGQKQRVSIARAMSISPKILLCDEATSALDPKTAQSIIKLLQKINTELGVTIVLVTHQMEIVKRACHRVALISGGKIREVASIPEILHQTNSAARNMIFADLSPEIPPCLQDNMQATPTDRVIIRLSFEGPNAALPFISQTSRLFGVDINILLANIDRIDGHTVGVSIIELCADTQDLQKFIQHCQNTQLGVEILGYVDAPLF